MCRRCLIIFLFLWNCVIVFHVMLELRARIFLFFSVSIFVRNHLSHVEVECSLRLGIIFLFLRSEIFLKTRLCLQTLFFHENAWFEELFFFFIFVYYNRFMCWNHNDIYIFKCVEVTYLWKRIIKVVKRHQANGRNTYRTCFHSLCVALLKDFFFI